MKRGDNIPSISDYAHYNEEAEAVWYAENKYDMEHWDEPMDGPEDDEPFDDDFDDLDDEADDEPGDDMNDYYDVVALAEARAQEVDDGVLNIWLDHEYMGVRSVAIREIGRRNIERQGIK